MVETIRAMDDITWILPVLWPQLCAKSKPLIFTSKPLLASAPQQGGDFQHPPQPQLCPNLESSQVAAPWGAWSPACFLCSESQLFFLMASSPTRPEANITPFNKINYLHVIYFILFQNIPTLRMISLCCFCQVFCYCLYNEGQAEDTLASLRHCL